MFAVAAALDRASPQCTRSSHPPAGIMSVAHLAREHSRPIVVSAPAQVPRQATHITKRPAQSSCNFENHGCLNRIVCGNVFRSIAVIFGSLRRKQRQNRVPREPAHARTQGNLASFPRCHVFPTTRGHIYHRLKVQSGPTGTALDRRWGRQVAAEAVLFLA